jgi:lipoprotein NlpI
MGKLRRFALPFALILVCAAPCFAQIADDLKSCIDYSQTNPNVALQSCTSAIQSGILSQPNLAIAFYRRGVAYFAKFDYDHALQDYDQALLLNPDFPQAHNNRGAIYSDRGRFDHAISEYDEAIRLLPNYPLAFYNRGNAYTGKGEFDRAIQDYDQSIKLNPNYAPAFNNRGNAYCGKGEYDRGIQDYDQAIKLAPNYDVAFDNRGLAYKNKGDFARAIQDYDQAVRINSRVQLTLYHRGQAQFALSQYALAQKDFAAALQLQPKNAYNVIWAYIAQVRSGSDVLTDFQKNAAALDMTKWPAIMVSAFQGTATTADVMAAAKDPDPRKEKSHTCEAYFFLAERALIAGNNLEAASFLQRAVDTGATQNLEYSAAKDELRRLKSGPSR